MAFTRYNPDTGDMVLGRLPGHQSMMFGNRPK